MPLIAKRPERDIPPQGMWDAVCVDVIDLGMVRNPFSPNGEQRHMCRIVWEIATTKQNGLPYWVFRDYALTLGYASNLRRDIEGWRGRPMSEEELEGFDIERLIGAACRVVIKHVHASGKVKLYIVITRPDPNNIYKPTGKYERKYYAKHDQYDGDRPLRGGSEDGDVPEWV